jgi:hypothetical protein
MVIPPNEIVFFPSCLKLSLPVKRDKVIIQGKDIAGEGAIQQ